MSNSAGIAMLNPTGAGTGIPTFPPKITASAWDGVNVTLAVVVTGPLPDGTSSTSPLNVIPAPINVEFDNPVMLRPSSATTRMLPDWLPRFVIDTSSRVTNVFANAIVLFLSGSNRTIYPIM